MKQSRLLLSIAILVSMTVTLVLMAQTPTAMTAAELTNDQPPAVSVRVAAVTVGPVQAGVTFSGNVASVQAIPIVPQVGGRLVQMNVNIGDAVKAGQVIAQIDTQAPTANLLQAYANLYLAQAKLDQMYEGPRTEQVAASLATYQGEVAKLDQLKAPLDPYQLTAAKAPERAAAAALQQAQAAYDKIAWSASAGLKPEALALQQATTAYEQAKANYEEQLAGAKPEAIRAQQASVDNAAALLALAKTPYRPSDFTIARASVYQGRAAVVGAQIQLNNCTIRSPIDGLVSDIPVSMGTVVGTQNPIMTIVTPNVDVQVKVPGNQINQITAGQPVSLTVVTLPNEQFRGVVGRIAPVADPTDRTFLVQVTPENTNNHLKAGMFAEVNFVTQQRAHALLVPQTALVEEDDATFAYVVMGDRAERRQVTTGLRNGSMVEVLSGLVLGERVIVSGQHGLKDGASVEVLQD